ncbi:putative transcriptional activator Myb, partial [Massarina eburnea CBS 473.64]
PSHGPPNLVGHEGMPPPAPRPRGPKLKFTPEDDQLLVDLKEKKNLAWKQIADFFPGRSSGTLQVRYCTKLKAKTTVWTDEMVQKLRSSMEEYENDRWRIIASKVGSGFSPAACREKAEEIA